MRAIVGHYVKYFYFHYIVMLDSDDTPRHGNSFIRQEPLVIVLLCKPTIPTPSVLEEVFIGVTGMFLSFFIWGLFLDSVGRSTGNYSSIAHS